MAEAEQEKEPASARQYMLIKNETVDGKKFRPSDWADRLQSTLSCLSDEQFGKCIGMVQVTNRDGNKCILVDMGLRDFEPRLYRFLMRFCEENRLATETTELAGGKETKAGDAAAASTFRRALSF